MPTTSRKSPGELMAVITAWLIARLFMRALTHHLQHRGNHARTTRNPSDKRPFGWRNRPSRYLGPTLVRYEVRRPEDRDHKTQSSECERDASTGADPASEDNRGEDRGRARGEGSDNRAGTCRRARSCL